MYLMGDPLARVLVAVAEHLTTRKERPDEVRGDPETDRTAAEMATVAITAALHPGWVGRSAIHLIYEIGEARRARDVARADRILWRLRNRPGLEPCPTCIDTSGVPIGAVGPALTDTGKCWTHSEDITVGLVGAAV